jgi:hypothetical protein
MQGVSGLKLCFPAVWKLEDNIILCLRKKYWQGYIMGESLGDWCASAFQFSCRLNCTLSWSFAEHLTASSRSI